MKSKKEKIITIHASSEAKAISVAERLHATEVVSCKEKQPITQNDKILTRVYRITIIDPHQPQ